MDMESIVMDLIINAGEAKSYAMQAYSEAKKGNWEAADNLLNESTAAAKRAHTVQTMLIGLDEGCGKVNVNLVLVHAQDHIMTSMLARELIEELINIQRLIQSK